MSGSTIGGAIGFVVGAYFGNPQAGYMIGSAIGGAAAPEHIRAPGIGDAQQQTSQAGIPIPVIFGKPQRIKCNIIDGERKARKIIVEEQQGKGGPVVESERFLLTTAFGISEGPIAGIQRILRNGEVIYDRTTDGEWQGKYPGSDFNLLAEIALKRRAKTQLWQNKIRIYLGTEDQLPDPALETIHGVGNTPYFRGLAYFVVEDDDVTQGGGRANIWEVEPVAEGVEATIESSEMLPGRYSLFTNAHWPLAGEEDDYDYVGHMPMVNTSTSGGLAEVVYAGTSLQDVIDHFTRNDYTTFNALAQGGRDPSHYIGWSASTDTSWDSSPLLVDSAVEQPDARDNAAVLLIYNDWVPDAVTATSYLSGPESCPLVPYNFTLQGGRGEVYRRFSSAPGGQIFHAVSCPGGNIFTLQPLAIRVTPKRRPPVTDLVPVPGASGYGTTLYGATGLIPTYTEVAGAYKVLGGLPAATLLDGRLHYRWVEQGPVLASTDPNYNVQAYWDARYAEAVAAGTMPAGLSYNTDYPIVVSSVWRADSSFDTLEATDVTLQSVVEAMASRAGLPAGKLDASALGEDIIPGYLVATGGGVADAIRPTQAVFTYDTPEIDGQIVCVKRGGDTVVTITDDDMLELTDEDSTTTPQQVEYPRKLHLIVPDPDANYTPTPQTFERYTPDVRAVGEQQMGVPIPFRADEAKQRVEVIGKVAWSRAEGVIDEIPLPEYFSRYVASDCFSYGGKRWLIEEASYADGIVKWKAVYDRQSNYTGVGTGAAANPELPTGSTVGATVLRFLNIPQVRDEDDKIGLYVAVSGTTDTWPGCTIQGKLATEASWRNLGTASTQSVMGELTSDLPYASPYFLDTENSVDVLANGTLSSVTSDQMYLELNGAVIGDSPLQEVIQFQTATPGAEEDEYTLEGSLARGRLNSTPRAHYTGASFVLLNAPVFVEVPASWVNQTIMLRAVTNGTDAEDAPSVTVDWRPVNAQTEWVPVQFASARDTSNNIAITWNGRGRLGTTALAANSAFFSGYRLSITKSGVVKQYTVLAQRFDYSAAQQTIDFGSATGTLDVRIEAMNRITGPSAPLLGSIA